MTAKSRKIGKSLNSVQFNNLNGNDTNGGWVRFPPPPPSNQLNHFNFIQKIL